MAKQVVLRPDWLDAPDVVDIYSVSHCVSSDFADYVGFWRHNGYWLFDSPDAIREVASEHGMELQGTHLFFYQVYELEYDDDTGAWRPFDPERDFATAVSAPEVSQLEGFDIVSFSMGSCPECSPLSCNSMAAEIRANPHCLLRSFEEARRVLEQGCMDQCEPGPYRIFAVYSVPW